MARVLLTGAFGNIGQYTTQYLLDKGHSVLCLDRKAPATEATAKNFGDTVDVAWGDITNEDDLRAAITTDIDVIIHLAALIPPITETNPALATKVNVDATQSMIAVAEEQAPEVRFIFASSVAVHGKDQTVRTPPLTAEHEYRPDDHYGETKMACELGLKDSKLNWTILRVCVAPPVEIDFVNGSHDHKMIFDISPKCRIEYVHPQDCALAFANAVDVSAVEKRILLLGGGESCQVNGLDFNNSIMAAYGIPELPAEAFDSGIPAFYGDYLDTSESQALLQYQQHSLADANAQSAASFGKIRHVVKLFGPIVRRIMLTQSPYYKDNKKKAKRG